MKSEDMINNIPSRLKIAIEYSNYTIERLSNDTKIDKDRIEDILNGKVIPEMIDIVLFSAYLDISCDYLCSCIDEIKRNSSKYLKNFDLSDISEESLDEIRKIVSLCMFLGDKEREKLLDSFIK